MSYTLKKLKQSEIDHGYQKPADKINTKPSYGIFIVCFVVTLSIFFVLLDQGKEIPSQQQISSSKQIADTLNKTPISSTPQKHFVDESSFVSNYEKKEKISLLPEKKALITKDTILSTPEPITVPSEHIEINPITRVEKELPIENPVNLDDMPESQDILVTNTNSQTSEKSSDDSFDAKESPNKNPLNLDDMPEDQDILAANTDTQTIEKNSDSSFDSGELETIQIKNEFEFDNEDNVVQNDKPVLWQNLSFSFRKSMPEMKLNGIIYLTNEEDRYVFINMTKYKIDDVVLEIGPSIEEIKQHSVIMMYENRQFIFDVNQ